MKQQILVAFEYAHAHDSWVTPVAEALEGLTADEALDRPNGATRSIWEIVLHVAVWNENIIERIESGRPARPAEGAWPPLPPSRQDRDWLEAKSRLRRSLNDLKAFIEASSLEELDRGPYGIADLLCRFTHIAYHLGQITKMREAIAEK